MSAYDMTRTMLICDIRFDNSYEDGYRYVHKEMNDIHMRDSIVHICYLEE